MTDSGPISQEAWGPPPDAALAADRPEIAVDRSEIAADRPELAVGAAFAGGFLLAMILKRLAR